MSTHVGRDEIETTKLEKALAVFLAAFVLLGAVWAYSRLDDAVGHGPAYEEVLAERPSDDQAVRAHDAAVSELQQAEQAVTEARTDLELSREAYRTALDEGRPAEDLRLAYEAARERHAAAERRVEAARAEEAATSGEAAAAQARISAELDRRADRAALGAFLARLGLAVVFLAGSFWLLGRLRRRGSRFLPLAIGLVAAATVLSG